MCHMDKRTNWVALDIAGVSAGEMCVQEHSQLYIQLHVSGRSCDQFFRAICSMVSFRLLFSGGKWCRNVLTLWMTIISRGFFKYWMSTTWCIRTRTRLKLHNWVLIKSTPSRHQWSASLRISLFPKADHARHRPGIKKSEAYSHFDPNEYISLKLSPS